MAITWNKIIPRWGGDAIEPPEAKKDTGYIAGDKPPAKWENWLRKGTYEALDETRDVIESIDSQMAQIEYVEMLQKDGVTQQVLQSGQITKVTWATRSFSGLDKGMVSFNGTGDIFFTKKGIYHLIGTVALKSSIPVSGIFVLALGGIQVAQQIGADSLVEPSLQVSRYVQFTEDNSAYSLSVSQHTGQSINISAFAYMQIRKVG